MDDATTTGDASTAADDTGYLQSWLDSGRSRPLDRPAYTIRAPLMIRASGQEVVGPGIDKAVITCAGDFGPAFVAVGLSNIRLSGFTVDCARAARSAAGPGLTTRTMGIGLAGCTGAVVEDVRVTGTVGGPAAKGAARVMSGVGIAISGGGRCVVRRCRLDDLGIAAEGKRSDGIFTSGGHHLIDDCDVDGATDTAFVIEDSDYSGVVNSRAAGCCGVLGITAATRESRGNFADGITAEGWSSSVVGGVQLAALAGYNLLDTAIYGLKLTGPGVGPAVNIRTATGATGRVVGVTIREPNLAGSGFVQGILANGDRIVIDRPAIAGFENGIQIQGTASGVTVLDRAIAGCSRFPLVLVGTPAGVRILGGGTAGIVALDGATFTTGG